MAVTGKRRGRHAGQADRPETPGLRRQMQAKIRHGTDAKRQDGRYADGAVRTEGARGGRTVPKDWTRDACPGCHNDTFFSHYHRYTVECTRCGATYEVKRD